MKQKPGQRKQTPASELRHFTNREDERALFLRHLELPLGTSLPVLMFYGVGGSGKTWLLRNLQEISSSRQIPSARLDFDWETGGQRYGEDSVAALFQIRQQLGVSCPRFDLAYAYLRVKQGAGGDPSLRGSGEAATAFEFVAEAGEALAKDIPGANVLAWLGKKAGGLVKQRLEHTALGHWLASTAGNQDALELRARTAQDIQPTLVTRLNQDLGEPLPQRSYKACRAVVFLDTFEAVNFGLQSDIQQHLREAWVRDLCANLDGVFFVLAGQNKLTCDEVDSDWSDPTFLEQHLIGDCRRRMHVLSWPSAEC